MNSIKVQVILGFVVMALSILVVGGFGTFVGDRSAKNIRFVADDLLELYSNAEASLQSIDELFGLVLLYTSQNDIEKLPDILQRIEDSGQTMTAIGQRSVPMAQQLGVNLGDMRGVQALRVQLDSIAAGMIAAHDSRLVESVNARAQLDNFLFDVDYFDGDISPLVDDLEFDSRFTEATILRTFVRDYEALILQLREVTLVVDYQQFTAQVGQYEQQLAALVQRSEQVLPALLERDASRLKEFVDIMRSAVSDESGLVQTQVRYLKASFDIQTELAAFEDTASEMIAALKSEFDAPIAQAMAMAKEDVTSFVAQATILNAVLMAATVLIAVGISWFLSRRIGVAINGVTDGLEKLSAGDLTYRIPALPTSEFQFIRNATNNLASQLQSMIDVVNNSASVMKQGSANARSVSEQTQQAVMGQEEEMHQVATAVTEMEAAIKEVAHNAVASSESVSRLVASAQENMELMRQTLMLMDQLKVSVDQGGNTVSALVEKTQQVETVLSVIEGISEQTNLLALNAAIEAARAGEQGRGFAVVADEVRSLASRSAESAKEIRDVISALNSESSAVVESSGENIERASQTMEYTQKSRYAMEDIIRELNSVDDMSTSIATASEEQTSVAREVAKSIHSVSEQTQSISESSRQAAQNSSSLDELSTELMAKISQFKV